MKNEQEPQMRLDLEFPPYCIRCNTQQDIKLYVVGDNLEEPIWYCGKCAVWQREQFYLRLCGIIDDK